MSREGSGPICGISVTGHHIDKSSVTRKETKMNLSILVGLFVLATAAAARTEIPEVGDDGIVLLSGQRSNRAVELARKFATCDCELTIRNMDVIEWPVVEQRQFKQYFRNTNTVKLTGTFDGHDYTYHFVFNDKGTVHFVFDPVPSESTYTFMFGPRDETGKYQQMYVGSTITARNDAWLPSDFSLRSDFKVAGTRYVSHTICTVTRH
jgi:hypothetical protein